ncbi:MAG: Na+/H+ antiporter subunit E [Halanaeroarchaeum sp.]
MKLPRWLLAAAILTVLWLFVRGVPLDPTTILGNAILGVVVSLAIAWTFRRLYEGRANVAGGLRVVPTAVVYLAVFGKELIVANVDVLYRVLHPSMPIEPAVIRLPLRVERPTAISTIANSITLTPGTLTMDYDAEDNALYVHTIDGTDPGAVVAPIRRWEDMALVIYGETADPDDPAPPIRVGGGSDGE